MRTVSAGANLSALCIVLATVLSDQSSGLSRVSKIMICATTLTVLGLRGFGFELCQLSITVALAFLFEGRLPCSLSIATTCEDFVRRDSADA